MYLSRVQVDRNNRQKTQDLTQLGAYHNWVEQSFPDEIASERRLRHLWRLDRLGSREFLLVLSDEKPDLKKLSRYGVDGSAATKDYEPLLNSVKEGQHLRFRLTANPTYTVMKDGDKRGKVYSHVTVTQQGEWLASHAEPAGFALEQVATDDGTVRDNFDVVGRDRPVMQHQYSRAVHLSRVSFEGVLVVKDLSLFKETLVKGIGREKAYGMGLLTIVPMR